MSYFTFAYTLTYTFVYMILQQIYSGNYVPIKFHQNRPSIIGDITKSRLVSFFSGRSVHSASPHNALRLQLLAVV